MMYAIIVDNKIAEIRSGRQPKKSPNIVELPADNHAIIGAPLDVYTPDWKLKSEAELVRLGYKEAPDHMIWDDSLKEFRTATDEELLREGRLTLKEREIVDNGAIRQMEPVELQMHNLITPDERRAWLAGLYQTKLYRLDEQSLRALRAHVAGTATEDDKTKLANIDKAAAQLRKKLREL
jgi:hypothetical protein